jgi:hypothetical protein
MVPFGNNPGKLADTLRHAVVDAAGIILRHLLLELGDSQFGGVDDLALVHPDVAGEYFQQGRFAAAVTTHQAHAFTGLERQVDVVEQRLVTEFYS